MSLPTRTILWIVCIGMPLLSTASGPRPVPTGQSPTRGAQSAPELRRGNATVPAGSFPLLRDFFTSPQTPHRPPRRAPTTPHAPARPQRQQSFQENGQLSSSDFTCPDNVFLPFISGDGYPNWLSHAQFDQHQHHHRVNLETWCRSVADCVCVRTDDEVVCPDPEETDREPRYPMLDWCQERCMCTHRAPPTELFSGETVREWLQRARTGSAELGA